MSKQEATPAPAPAPAPGADAAPAGTSKIAALLPVILVVVLAPVVSWAVAQFVILPQFEKKLNAVVATAGEHGAPADAHGAAPAAAHAAPAAEGGDKAGHGKKGDAAGPSNSYEFTNIVVNLAGTMGTRYLKTTFLVTGKDANLREYFNRDKAKMVDVTLNVLSSLSLADLEEAGAKNIIREKLVNAYNQAIGKKVAEQVYFSDFVVQ